MKCLCLYELCKILVGVVEEVVLCKNLGERRYRGLDGEEVEEVECTFIDEEC